MVPFDIPVDLECVTSVDVAHSEVSRERREVLGDEGLPEARQQHPIRPPECNLLLLISITLGYCLNML